MTKNQKTFALLVAGLVWCILGACAQGDDPGMNWFVLAMTCVGTCAISNRIFAVRGI